MQRQRWIRRLPKYPNRLQASCLQRLQVTSALTFSWGRPMIALRRHCGLPRVLNSPVFQFALKAGRIYVKGTEGIGPSICRLVVGCSIRLSYVPKGAFDGSRLRMPSAYLSIGGPRNIAVLLSRGLNSQSHFLGACSCIICFASPGVSFPASASLAARAFCVTHL